VIIAFNENALDLHAWIKVRWMGADGKTSLIETTVRPHPLQ
jgi:hypothetical protein